MHRFFVPADWLATSDVTISGPLVHHMQHVLRLRVGEHVVLLDNSGWEAEAQIETINGEEVRAVIKQRTLGTGEPRTKITLYQSLLKGDRFGYVLQKCTEIGVVEFVPVVSERCIVGDVDQSAERIRRWQRIIQEAAEQAHRSKLPVLRPTVLLANALESISGRGLSLIPWEEERSATLSSVLASKMTTSPHVPEPAPLARKKPTPPARRPFAIDIFIGPEGGFAAGEIAVARQYGAVPVTLGPRILRAETAGLVTATVILHQLGDLG